MVRSIKTFEIKYKPLLIRRYMTEMKSNWLVISGAGNAVCVLFFPSVIVFFNSSCSSVAEFTHMFSITLSSRLYSQLMWGLVNEGVGCGFRHSL